MPSVIGIIPGKPGVRAWKPACRFRPAMVRCKRGEGEEMLAVSSVAAQRRQSDAGGIKTAIDGENLSGDVAGAVAAQEEHRLRQLFLETVTIEQDRVVIVGANLRRMDGFRHRGLDRAGCDTIDPNAE